MNIPIVRRALGLSIFALGLASPVLAQGPQITSPAAGQVFKTGPDYATDVLQDPWDFLNVEDISPNPDEFGGWATSPASAWNVNGPGPTFIDGKVFRGTASGDNQLVMLYKGDAIGLNPPRTGIRFPINTTLYRKLAMKIRYIGAAGPPFFQPAVYWGHASYAATNYLNRAAGALFGVIPNGTTTDIYSLDLTHAGTGSAPSSQLIPACGGGGCTGIPAPWNAEPNVLGFRIDPTTQFSALGVEIDWVRLTASDGAANAVNMPVTYSGCTGSATIKVRDADNNTFNVATGTTTSANFNYGVLPPGTYTLIVSCNNGDSVGRSFTVNDPPRVTVIDPDEAGDSSTDYAFETSAGANRWDFEESTPSDVVAIANVSTVSGACAGVTCGIIPSDAPGAPAGSKMFRASSVGDTASTRGDPALDFLGGTTKPVSSSRNHLVTFSLRINEPYDVGRGSVLRFLWGSGTFSDQSTTTQSQDLRIWPGFQTYTVDLSTLTVANGGIETECLGHSPPCPTTPWADRSIRFFRIDPHEFGHKATSFDIDNVSLTAPDEVNLSGSGTGSSFTIRWTMADSDSSGSLYSTRVYLDRDRDPTSGKSEITGTPITAAPGSQQFVWTPPSTLAPGSYWVYVETTETRGTGGVTNVEGGYSTGQLVVYSTAATSPQISVSSPTAGQTVPFPFTITGCAYDAGTETGGLNMDDLMVYAIAGNNVSGVPSGTVYSLGYGSGLGALEYAPLTPSTPVVCTSITDTASPYRNAGFRVTNVGLNGGNWTLRVLGRSKISARISQIGSDIPVTVTTLSGAPENLQVSATGNVVTLTWSPPTSGPAISGYAIDLDDDSGFNSINASQTVPASVTSGTGTLFNGTWYLRVVSIAIGGARQAASETKSITVPAGGPVAPNSPVLTATQVTSNPITLSWAPGSGSGGAPTSYTVIAGTTPGGSQLGTFPMGSATSISAAAPLGTRVYVRVIANNAGGASATSNEINFILAAPAAPGTPTLNPATLSGRNVTLTWAAGSGSAPTTYTIQARLSPTGPVIASLPATGNSTTVPAPAGTFFVTIVANNAAGTSAESNQITIVVP